MQLTKIVRSRLYWFVIVLMLTLAIGRQVYLTVAAEQSGGSPTSAVDSRMKRLVTDLTDKNYGNPSATVFGENWGPNWNRIVSAAQAPFSDALVNGMKNGGNSDFPQSVGGIHDANPLPSGSYRSTWVVCNSGNNYCGSGDSLANRMDNNTGLIWTDRISSSSNWFTANNCAQPGSGENPGSCVDNGDAACKCVKLTSSKTGCEAQGDGNWRLPQQKELMMAYIDGSAEYMPNSDAYHWASTTYTTSTQYAWYTSLSNGHTTYTTKTTGSNFRCVR